jgi:hypothetical protein
MPVVAEVKRLDTQPGGRIGDEGKGAPFQEPMKNVVDTARLGTIDKEALVGFLRDGRLRVHSPFTVKFTTEKPYVIAEAAEFNEFGFGENVSEALVDLQYAIAELYFTLESEQHRLSSDLQNVWSVLQQKIQKIQK